MQPLHGQSCPWVRHGLDPRAEEGAVQAFIELRDLTNPVESRTRVVKPDILDISGFKSHRILIALAVRIAGRMIDFHLIEACGKSFDLAEVFEDGAMFEADNVGRHEYAEVTDFLVGEIDDALVARFQVFRALINGGNPAESLVRRRDVVTVSCATAQSRETATGSDARNNAPRKLSPR